MRKILYPLAALLFGAAGYFLRLRQLAEARDPNTGMLLPSGPETVHLVCLTLGAAAALLVFALTVPRSAVDWRSAFHSRNPLHRLLSCAAALGFGGAGALIGYRFWLDRRYGNPGIFRAVFAALLVVSCIAALLLLFRKVDREEEGSILPVLPGFSACVWLVLTYHGNASNPSTLEYIWQLLAVVSACLAWYYAAGFVFRRCRHRRAAFFQLLTVTLCVISLADETELFQRVLLASTALWFLTQSAALFTPSQYLGRREEKA